MASNKWLDEILENLTGYAVTNSNYAGKSIARREAKQAIFSKIEEAIGEDEVFEMTGDYGKENIDHRNQLRAEIKEKLGL